MQFMVASTFLRNRVSIEKWLDANTFVKWRNTALWKKLFPAINEKMFFRNNYFTFDRSQFLLVLKFLYICQKLQPFVISAFIN